MKLSLLLLAFAAFSCVANARRLTTTQTCEKRAVLDHFSSWNDTPGNMRPLPCAPGWNKLTDERTIHAFLDAEFAQAQEEAKYEEASLWCKNGVATRSFSEPLLSCVLGADVQTQAVVTYSCKDEAGKKQMGLNAEGKYIC